jgi:hypothetical protein
MEGEHQMCFFVTHMSGTIYLSLAPWRVSYWELLISILLYHLQQILPFKLAIDKNTKPRICAGVCALVSAI